MTESEKAMRDAEEFFKKIGPLLEEQRKKTAAMTDEEFEAYLSECIVKEPLTPQERENMIREGRLYIDYIDIPEPTYMT